jgi:hypothetical protein
MNLKYNKINRFDLIHNVTNMIIYQFNLLVTEQRKRWQNKSLGTLAIRKRNATNIIKRVEEQKE